MKLHITISFDEEHDLDALTTWPALVEAVRERIEDDPAGYLDSAAHDRSHLRVKIEIP